MLTIGLKKLGENLDFRKSTFSIHTLLLKIMMRKTRNRLFIELLVRRPPLFVLRKTSYTTTRCSLTSWPPHKRKNCFYRDIFHLYQCIISKISLFNTMIKGAVRRLHFTPATFACGLVAKTYGASTTDRQNVQKNRPDAPKRTAGSAVQRSQVRILVRIGWISNPRSRIVAGTSGSYPHQAYRST
jgi:hypothetical protein